MSGLNVKDIIESYSCHKCHLDLIDEVSKPKHKAATLRRMLPSLMDSMGIVVTIQNEVFQELERVDTGPGTIPPALAKFISDAPTPDQYLQLQQALVDRVTDAFTAMAARLDLPLRSSVEQPSGRRRRGDDVSFRHTFELPEDEDISFLYTPDDLLDAVMQLESPNIARKAAPPGTVGRMGVLLSGDVSLKALLNAWPELSITNKHMGVDDRDDVVWFNEHYARGKALLSSPTALLLSVAREYAKLGIPSGLRPQLWALLLGVDLDEARTEYTRLRAAIRSERLLLDALTEADINLHGLDEHYFVFDSELYEIFSAALRDPALAHARHPNLHPSKGSPPKSPSPSGMLPVAGFVRYIGPFCMLSSDPAEAYGLFRAVYNRYICGFHQIVSSRVGLPYLCSSTEMLIATYCPTAAAFLETVGLTVLDVVHPWLVFGFAGFLAPVEWALLWDRVIAYDSVLPIAVLAAAVVDLRSDALLTLSSPDDVLDLFADFTAVQSIALIQGFLAGMLK